MDWASIQKILFVVQRIASCIGVLIIISGVIYAFSLYLYFFFTGALRKHSDKINLVRLDLGRVLILGLEFIVAADLIGTTTAPDYYTVGVLAIIVAIRIVLNYSLNREMVALSKQRV